MGASIEKLKTIVGELEDELHRLPEIDQQANELLQEAVQEIQAVLHVRQHGGSPSDEGEPETEPAEAEPAEEADLLTGRLRQAALQFEESHPNLTGILSRLIDGLGQMGI
jgi:hypothetical protein